MGWWGSMRLLAGGIIAVAVASGCEEIAALVDDYLPSTEPQVAPEDEPQVEAIEEKLPERPASSTARSETEVITFRSILENPTMTREQRIRAFENLDPAALQKPVVGSNVSGGPTTATTRGPPGQAGPSAPELAAARRRVPVVMYSTDWCGVCRRARQYFAENQISFEEHDVDRDPRAREEYLRLNPRRSVPTIKVGDEVIVGFSAQAVNAALDSAARRRLN